jgi:flagellar L-ring protein precursor FlgH
VNVRPIWTLIAFACAAGPIGAEPQSSSLYMIQPMPAEPTRDDGLYVNPYMQAGSYLAVAVPEPREFKVHDLVTIIVRESSTATVEGELTTEKEVDYKGKAQAFINLTDLLTSLQIEPAPLKAGVPEVDVSFGKEFEGEGDFARKDEVVTRLTAQVVDVKPNGLLALEARTHIRNDDEQVTITVTGYCRAEDVSADNAVLSTQMFDLRVSTWHAGEVRDASKKGVVTKALDFLFNF